MLKAIFIVAALTYAVIAGVMYLYQRSFIYFPDTARIAPRDAGLPDVTERLIKTPDGETLVTWYAPAKPGGTEAARTTILYFHGNAAHLEARHDRMRTFLDQGHGMMLVAYRGYSGSTGTPTEKNIVADAKHIYDLLVSEGVAPRDLVVYGESLGAAVAVQLAAEKPVRGVVLDSPFTSLVARAYLSYPLLPVGLLLKDRYLSDAIIKNVHAPVLVIQGDRDEVTPVAMGKALFAAANEPKTLMIIAGAGHSNHDRFGSLRMIGDWIDRLPDEAR